MPNLFLDDVFVSYNMITTWPLCVKNKIDHTWRGIYTPEREVHTLPAC